MTLWARKLYVFYYKNSLKFIFGCNILGNTIHSCKILWQNKKNNVENIYVLELSLSRRISFWWISTEACYKNNFTSSNLDVNFNFVNKTTRISEQPNIKVTHPYIRNSPIEIDSGCDVLANREPIRLINYTSKIKKNCFRKRELTDSVYRAINTKNRSNKDFSKSN